jgi:hypothetical protein
VHKLRFYFLKTGFRKGLVKYQFGIFAEKFLKIIVPLKLFEVDYKLVDFLQCHLVPFFSLSDNFHVINTLTYLESIQNMEPILN